MVAPALSRRGVLAAPLLAGALGPPARAATWRLLPLAGLPVTVDRHGTVLGSVAQGGVRAAPALWRVRDGRVSGPWVLPRALDTDVPTAVNSRGDVVGTALGEDPPDAGAYLWPRGGDPVRLPMTQANHIADDGTVTGFRDLDGREYAVLWRCGRLTVLPGIGGPGSSGITTLPDGRTLGWALRRPAGSDDTALQRAVVWQHGVPRELGTFGGPTSLAPDMDDRGVAVGWATRPDGSQRAFRWSDGRLTDISPPGATDAAALAVDRAGDAAGTATLDGARRAFRRRGATTVVLPVPAGGGDTVAVDIDDDASVLGSTGSAPGFSDGQVVVWAPDGTPAVLPAASTAPGASAHAFAISRGVVVGTADRSTTTSGAVWVR